MGEGRCQVSISKIHESKVDDLSKKGKGPYPQQDFLYDDDDSTSNVALGRRVKERCSRSSNDKKRKKSRHTDVDTGTPSALARFLLTARVRHLCQRRHENFERQSKKKSCPKLQW